MKEDDTGASQISTDPTAADFPSNCTVAEAARCAELYKVSREYDLRVPNHEQRAHAPPQGYAAVYSHHFTSGLTLPPPPLVVAVLEHYKIALAQLHPNAVLIILGFVKICEGLSIVPAIGLLRHFFELRRSPLAVGWFTLYAVLASSDRIVQRRHPKKVYGWKESFLFFKITAEDRHGMSLCWNDSPDLDPPLAEEEMPSEQAISMLKNSSSKRKCEDSKGATEMKTKNSSKQNTECRSKRLKRIANSPATEPAETTTEDQFALHIQKSVTSFNLQLKQEKEELKKVVAAKEQEVKDKDIKIASLQGDNQELQKLVINNNFTSRKKDVEENEKLQKVIITAMGNDIQSKDKEIALLKEDLKEKNDEIAALKSKLQSVVGDRGPLLKAYTHRLLKSKGFARFSGDLITSAQRLGGHKAAKKLRRHFPAIPEEALVAIEDPRAGSILDNLFYNMIQDDAFKFPLLEHLLSLEEIPSSSELKNLEVDKDRDALIPPPPVPALLPKIEQGLLS